jgi:hypothetical protein
MVGYCQQARFHFYDVFNVGTVDPDVAGTEPIRGAAGNDSDRSLAAEGARSLAGGCRDRFTGHKSSSHSHADGKEG